MGNPYPIGYKLSPKVNTENMTDTEKINWAKDYVSLLSSYANEYIAKLPSADLITHRSTFQGLLKSCAIRAGRPDYKCQILMDTIYHWYYEMCSIYQQAITLEKYCILISCSVNYFNDFIKSNGSKDDHIGRIIAYDELQNDIISSMQEGAMTGNPGYIFILKAKHGWSDQPQSIQSNQTDSVSSLEQIAQSIGVPTVDSIEPNQSVPGLPGDILSDD